MVKTSHRTIHPTVEMVDSAIAALDGASYGLALKAWLDYRYSEPVNHSRMYQNLAHLIDVGLVRATEDAFEDER